MLRTVRTSRRVRSYARRLRIERLEDRLALDGTPQLALPMKVGETFVVDDFDNKVTKNDTGFNYFGGNSGSLNNPTLAPPAQQITTLSISSDSNQSTGGSLRIGIDFTVQGSQEAFGGYFTSLFGLTDTKVSLLPGQNEPPTSTPFAGYYLNFDNVYGAYQPLTNRAIEQVAFDARLDTGSAPLTIKVELKDEAGRDIFTRRQIGSADWQPFTLSRSSFNQTVSGGEFNFQQVTLLSILVERVNVADGIVNPDTGALLVDNIRLKDVDGQYPDLAAATNPSDGTLLPQYQDAFLDHVRGLSSLYFLDFASRDTRTGGIVQDRSTFADLMSIGGVGFQLTSYVIDAESEYLSRTAAADRVHAILDVLANHSQGPQASGTIGYQGFFYHFLGIDGLRKHNFDFDATPVDESLNTVELSTIDTALAIAGVVTAGQYFDGNSSTEVEIRSLANEIYGNVNWAFMLNTAPGPDQNQFYLGWKPNESRSGAAFQVPDASGAGAYSGTLADRATLDYYTDEGLLIALLAMGSPNPAHRLSRAVWDAMIRSDEGGSFVKTFPGSLFTYQFASTWLDTQLLGMDNHPTHPVNFYENTRDAIQATIAYATANPLGHSTLSGGQWGLSAAEGPFDAYFAEAAPAAAIHPGGAEPAGEATGFDPPLVIEGESGTGSGSQKSRGFASGGSTVLLLAGQSRTYSFQIDEPAVYHVIARYSNDNFGPLETVSVSMDGMSVGSFSALDTGDFGNGWNAFLTAFSIGSKTLSAGSHSLTVTVSGGDGGGAEIDYFSLIVERPLELGTVTNYGVASSIVQVPDESIAGLWNNARHADLNQDGSAELLNPRFGFADAFNSDISDGVIPGVVDPSDSRVVRADGSWIQVTGFGIDHGPMLIMIDNFLEDQFIPRLFMSHPQVRSALGQLFPSLHVSVGDYNSDGAVGAADYVVWRKTLGTAVTPYSGADGSGNGLVDPNDFGVWRSKFGTMLSAAGVSSGQTAFAPSKPASHFDETVVQVRNDAPVLSANTNAADAHDVRFAQFERLRRDSKFGLPPREHSNRHWHSEQRSEEHLLLATNQARASLRENDFILVDSENDEHLSEESDHQSRIDETLASMFSAL